MKPIMRRRGQAAVEMAVTTIVLVPLILYTLFLEDMLAYKLENQEPTIVAGWDYITNNYMKGSEKRDIGRMNRLKYCDHTAAYDSYDKPYDCDKMSTDGASGEDSGGSGSGSGDVDISGGGGGGSDKGHHQTTAAHQCWILPGADQVRCTLSKTAGITMFNESAVTMYSQMGEWNQGGLVTCGAQLGVMNYMLPNKVWGLMGMQETKKGDNTREGGNNGRVGMSSKGRFQDGKTFDELSGGGTQTVHGDAEGSNAAENSWILTKEEFAVMADPWALNLIDEKVTPGTGSPITSFIKPGMMYRDFHHPLLDRSGHYYNEYMKDGNDAANDYFDQMKDYLNDSMLFGANYDGLGPLGGDKPDTLPVYWDKDVQRSNNGGKASGYEDSRQAQASSGRSEYPW